MTFDVTDASGYRVTDDDLEFLDLTADGVIALQERRFPLGMTAARFDLFVRELERALDHDGIRDADVRLQGSSARFFSGAHKRMPSEAREIAGLIRDSGRFPFREELEEIVATIEARWPVGSRPVRRPFDLTSRLRIDYVLSDYDVQVSSAELVRRATEFHERQGAGAHDLRWTSEHYNFITKDLYGVMCPNLVEWAVRQGASLGRGVSIAVFDQGGPPRSEVDEELSSHFREDDWVLLSNGGRDEVG